MHDSVYFTALGQAVSGSLCRFTHVETVIGIVAWTTVRDNNTLFIQEQWQI